MTDANAFMTFLLCWVSGGPDAACIARPSNPVTLATAEGRRNRGEPDGASAARRVGARDRPDRLVGARRAQHQRIGEPRADELQADRQPLVRQAAGMVQAAAGEVEG